MAKGSNQNNNEATKNLTLEEEQHEANKDVAKVGYKAIESAYLKDGGLITDTVSKTKAGDQILDKTASVIDKTPIGSKGTELKKSGALNKADSALGLIGGKGGNQSPSNLNSNVSKPLENPNSKGGSSSLDNKDSSKTPSNDSSKPKLDPQQRKAEVLNKKQSDTPQSDKDPEYDKRKELTLKKKSEEETETTSGSSPEDSKKVPDPNEKKEKLDLERKTDSGSSSDPKEEKKGENKSNVKDQAKSIIKDETKREVIKEGIKTFVKTHPIETAVIIAIILSFFVFLAIILIVVLQGEGKGSEADFSETGWNCSYSVGSENYSNVQVELVNCNATASNYTVLETIPFEKYVLGVALAEAGESTSNEALKAQMVAVRNFALTRNETMCPSNPKGCFYGYNSSTNTIRLRACTNDQVYWDYTKDIYKSSGGKVALFSPEVDQNTSGAVVWKKALSASRQAEVEALASEVMGKLLLNSNGSLAQVSYTATETNKFINLANQGKDYTEILMSVYGTNNSVSTFDCNYEEVDSSAGVVASGDYSNWKQKDPRWSGTRIGTCTLGKVGCLITSISIQVARSGAKTSLTNFNPGTFAQALNSNGGVASNCNFMGVNYVKKIVPSITQASNDNIYGYSKAQVLSYLRQKIEAGCYMVLEVKGHGTRSSTGQHWVAVDDISTKNSNYTKLFMWDPATKSTDLFAKYGNRITIAKCLKF